MSEANTPGTPLPPGEFGRKRLPRSAALSPDNPPLLEEGDLSHAEEKVLEVFRKDWEEGRRGARFVPGAILRADFLRSLFLGSYDRFAPRSVIISRARIEGRLDLDYCESLFPIGFSECFFSEGISLRAATIPELILIKCRVNQDDQGSSLFSMQAKVTTNVILDVIAYGKVDLSNADIGGQLSLAGSRFEEALTVMDLKTGQSVILGKGFKSYGNVNLTGADIGGKLDCSGGRFEEGLKAPNLKTGTSVFMMEGFKSYGKVNLFGADIGGQFSCIGGYFEEGLTAQSLKISKDVLLSEGFKSNGKVDLLGADIGGVLSCEGGCFEKGLIAQNLKTGTNVFLRKGFKSYGKVNLNEAIIGGQLDCRGGRFEEGLTAQNLKTGTNVFLREGFKSYGKVDLNEAIIGGQLDCHGGRFEEGLIAQNLKTDRNVFLSDGFKSDGEVDLSSANIGGKLVCTGGHFGKKLIADGLRYQYIDLGSKWEEVLAWLRKIKMQEGGLQPYEQLMTVYRRMGRPDWARRIGFELGRKRHDQFS